MRNRALVLCIVIIIVTFNIGVVTAIQSGIQWLAILGWIVVAWQIVGWFLAITVARFLYHFMQYDPLGGGEDDD